MNLQLIDITIRAQYRSDDLIINFATETIAIYIY